MSIEERKQEEKAERRTAILDAAEAVLADTSPESMTMGKIASKARLSRSLLYVYFEDMDDIVLGVTLRAFRDLVRRFNTAVAEHDIGLWQIRAIGEAYVRFAHETPTYFELVARFEARESSAGDRTDHAKACLAASDEAMHRMVEAIGNGIDDGSIRSDLDPTRTALTLWGYTHGLIQLGVHKQGMLQERYEVDVDSLVDYGLTLAGDALHGHIPAAGEDEA